MTDTPNNQSSRFAKWIGWILLGVSLPVIGALQPFWSPYAEMTSRSLSVRVTSKVPLQVPATSSMPDLVVSVGGRALTSPYLSTVVLTNNSAKPIPTSDYESPIEFAVGKDVEIARVIVTAISPQNLKSVITVDKQAVRLKPMLLNQGDSLQFTILTTGKFPMFVPGGRIVGIPNFDFQNDPKPKIGWKTGLAKTVLYVLATILYPLCAVGVINPKAVPSIRWLAAGGVIVSMAMSSSVSAGTFGWLGLDFDDAIFATITSALIFAFFIRRSPIEVWR